MTTQPYIAIEGPIGVGKTTLARILGETLPAEVLLEVFEENPFLSSFYADRARYAFQTQVFFLLSRYRQQHKVIAQTIQRSLLVSDYLFAKDWLFAHLNLAGDELTMYERVYSILGEQIPAPDLVVYLKASTDTLMQRITHRDRPYERQMSPEYINDLRHAYERFFADYTASPLLVLDSNDLDVVRDLEARNTVVRQVRAALDTSIYQPMLPEMDSLEVAAPVRGGGRRLPDFQRLQQARDREDGSNVNLFMDYLQLSSTLGELGHILTGVWKNKDELLPLVGNDAKARDRAVEAARGVVQSQLADVLRLLLKLANDAGIDLESAYMRQFSAPEQSM